jgi:FG-GAP-like repeat
VRRVHTLASAAVVASVAAIAAAPPRSDPGEAAVRRTCAVCHALPPPSILPRSAWPGVVRDMAGLIVEGVGLRRGQPPPPADFDIEQVSAYYESRAPRELPSPAPWPPPGPDAALFARHVLGYAGAPGPAVVANVRLLPLGPDARREIVAADMMSGLVLAGGAAGGPPRLRLLSRVPHPCHVEAVDLDRDGRTDLLVADLGTAAPSDAMLGTVTWLRAQADGTYQPVTLAAGLPRVADVEAGDFDGDGDLDLVVAAFGWRRVGGIRLLENRTTDWSRPVFVSRELDERTGAIHVPVVDLDGDGRLDFVALLAQQHETVVAFLGDGKGGFRKETIDQAPHPGWGSSGLQIVDLDRDGDLDVLVTNGDMLDDLQLKPYHGIRWLENRGRFPFVAHDLAPLFGVLRAQAADLDGDGDLDIVACALLQLQQGPAVDAGQPSLVWLEQTARGRFERHTLEVGRRHLSLDLGDWDGDGDVDIVTATALSGTEEFAEVWENRRPGRGRSAAAP